MVQYLTEGFARIFSPTDDHYPETGVQPFDSEPYATPKS
ncbi:isochorismate synthase [Aphanothece hegewaldii CCALA 016]|uniref:Isochorismate synthase n=1 Tax=Aphanothece hegewaldii CCALA 016 TaxID=2107694 RepID=A0A2T1M485_9CHRO|nr:isochorismate synthase [Aphanothece hegewaldii CCALA 016]